jgi:hypothetical protein
MSRIEITKSRWSAYTMTHPEVQVLGGGTLISDGEAVANEAHKIPSRI